MRQREYEALTLAQMQTKRWVTVERMRNGYVTIPKGTEVAVIGKRGGLQLRTLGCPACGLQVSISRVRPTSVEELL